MRAVHVQRQRLLRVVFGERLCRQPVEIVTGFVERLLPAAVRRQFVDDEGS